MRSKCETDGMDCMNDVSPMSDPFLCLNTDLDDVSEVIRSNWACRTEMSTTDMDLWSEINAVETPSNNDPLLSYGQFHHNVNSNHLQQLPPDTNTCKNIGSIVSSLQEGDQMFGASQNPRHHYHQYTTNEYLSYRDEQLLLPSINGIDHANVINPVHNLSFPTAAPPLSNPSSTQQNAQANFQKMVPLNGEHVPTVDMNNVHKPYITMKQELWHNETELTSNGQTHNTKQELLDLLASMTPAEVERLRAARHNSAVPSCASSPPYVNRKGHPMTVGVATKMPLTCAVSNQITNNNVDLCSPATTQSSENGSSMLSPRTSSSTASADMTMDTNDSDTDGDSGTATIPRPKTERRTAHNLIEKKYRCSINDRIQCLKTMLTSENTKLSKAATLRKAIEHISTLRQENEHLHHEVERLRMLLSVNRIEDVGAPVSIVPPQNSNSMSSPLSSPDPSPRDYVPRSSSKAKRSRTMVDKSRVAMLAFMFALVIWNPVSLFIDSSYPTAASDAILRPVMPGRSLQQVVDTVPFDTAEADTIWWRDSIVRPCFVWSVNIFIVFCFLTRVLVYGEPVADSKSSSWTLFLTTKSTADRFIKLGNHNEASRQLKECLRVLERPLPTTGFDELVSVVWQVIRHLLNSVYLGRWFARRKRSPAKPVTVVCRSHAYTALIYHQLHQLHLIGVESIGDGLTGLNLALSAVNLAESAGCSADGLSHAHRADIYLNTAVRVRITLPRFIGIPLYLYFMRRARSHARRADAGTIEGISWVFHPLSRKFLSSRNLIDYIRDNHQNHFPFIKNHPSIRPFERLTSAFKMQLLTTLLNQLSAPSVPSTNMQFVDVSHLLLTICTVVPQKVPKGSTYLDEFTLNANGDELCTWWTHLFTCALYWKHLDNGNAQKHYALVRNCPSQLLKSNLSLAIGHAFCSRKLCMDDRGNRHFQEVVWANALRSYCSLQRISECDAKTLSTISPAATIVHDMVVSVSLEWLLLSILDVWYSQMSIIKPYWEQTPTQQLKQLYENAFVQFRAIARKTNGCSQFKVAVFELASRMLNAANPISTWRTFVRFKRNQRIESFITNPLSMICCPQLSTISSKYQSNVFNVDILRKLHSDINTFTMTSP